LIFLKIIILNIKKLIFNSILLIILIDDFNSLSKYLLIQKKNIFTFWEPRDKIPGYLKLCIRTWKKFLPSYEIIILDYQLSKKLLGLDLFSKIICKNMSFPLQADAIRVALLYKYGGIWLDTDTIILNSEFIKKFIDYELGMFGEVKKKIQYIAFIYSIKNSSLLTEWLNEIIIRVKTYKSILFNKNNTIIWEKSFKKVYSNFYLGYSIIDSLLKNITDKKYYRLDAKSMNIFPERTLFNNSNNTKYENLYKEFYFEKRDPEFILKKNISLILLHNSWTPLKYKRMSEYEFLNQDILISKLLSKLLNN
jgi:mannosyltransferase OCH1-like enzyme